MKQAQTPIDEIARSQIRQWLRSTGTTQVSFAEQIGRNQEWISRYLNGTFDADLTTLQRMASVFGHNLATLFGRLPSDPDESALVMNFRGLRPDGRKIVLDVLRALNGQPKNATVKRQQRRRLD